MSRALYGSLIAVLLLSAGTGCHSPYYADQGALAGGLGGAGLRALIGSASGHTGAGAAIGAAAGALTGGAVGGALDNIDAKNRANRRRHGSPSHRRQRQRCHCHDTLRHRRTNCRQSTCLLRFAASAPSQRCNLSAAKRRQSPCDFHHAADSCRRRGSAAGCSRRPRWPATRRCRRSLLRTVLSPLLRPACRRHLHRTLTRSDGDSNGRARL